MVVRPRPNPETVAALLDTTWRVAEAERARTESLDRKASTLATFASLVLSLTAALGREAAADPRSFVPYVAGLLALVASVALAVFALLPKEQLTLAGAYLERLPKWSELLKDVSEVRGEVLGGLVDAVVREQRKSRLVQYAFVCLLGALAFLVGASILAARAIFE